MSRVEENKEMFESVKGEVLIDGKFRWIGKFVVQFLCILYDISKSLAIIADKMNKNDGEKE